MSYIVTFGQKYRHEAHPVLGFDRRLPDGYYTIEADSYDEAHARATETLGSSFFAVYDKSEAELGDALAYFPLGSLGNL